MKFYHGTPIDLSNGFQNIGLKNKNSFMAVTAGYYFTNNLETALNYSRKSNSNNNEYNFNYVYEIEIDDDYFKNHILNVSETGHHIVKNENIKLTNQNIVDIILQANNLEDKIQNFIDIDNKISPNKLKSYISDIVNQYYSIDLFEDNYVDLLNMIGNDWFHSNEELEICNRMFIKKTGIECFQRELDVEFMNPDNPTQKISEINLCFLDNQLINQKMKCIFYPIEKNINNEKSNDNENENKVLSKPIINSIKRNNI